MFPVLLFPTDEPGRGLGPKIVRLQDKRPPKSSRKKPSPAAEQKILLLNQEAGFSEQGAALVVRAGLRTGCGYSQVELYPQLLKDAVGGFHSESVHLQVLCCTFTTPLWCGSSLLCHPSEM